MLRIHLAQKIVTMVLVYLYVGLSTSCASEQSLTKHSAQVVITTSYKKMPVHFCLQADERVLEYWKKGQAYLELSVTHSQPLSSYSPTLYIAIHDLKANKTIPVDQFSLYSEAGVTPAKPARAQFFLVQLPRPTPEQQPLNSLCFELRPDLSENNETIEKDAGITISAGLKTRPD